MLLRRFVSNLISTATFLVLGSSVAFAEVPVIPVGHQDEQVIGGDVEILVDPDGQISFEETWSDPGKLKFQKSEKEVLNFGFSDSAIWVRFSLVNATSAPIERLFSVGYALLDEVIVEIKSGEALTRYEFGDLKPFAEREFYHRNFIFPVQFEPHEKLEVRMRVVSESSLRVPLTLWERDAFYQEDVVQMLLNGLYYGLMLVMALYNAFVYFSTGERSYLVYVCFVVAASLAQLAMSGLSYQFLWPSFPWWGGVSVVLFLALGTVFAGLFALEFLQLKDSFPRLTRALKVIIGLSCLVAACPSLSLMGSQPGYR